MIACRGMALALPEGSHNGHYVCLKVNIWAIPLQATINLCINWLLDFTLIPRFNQAIMGFTRPLWDLLGHYGSAIMGCASPVIEHRPA